MDAEKRHHLKQNELAEALSKLRYLGSRRDWLLWAAAAVVVVAVVIVYRNWGTWQERRVASAWGEFTEVSQKVESNTPGALDELRGIASSSKNPTLAAAARIRLAAALRAKATETGTVDTALLQQSVDVLTPLMNDSSQPPPIVGAAGLSLATSYESLGQFEDAQRVYNIILSGDSFAGTGYPAAAAERLETLEMLRKPVAFVAGLPPQAAPPAALTPEIMAGPPAPPVVTIETPAPPAQPPADPAAAAPESANNQAPAGNVTGNAAGTATDSETPAPATQPSGSQGP